MQKLSRGKIARLLATPLPSKIVPQVKEGSANSCKCPQTSTAVGLLSALDSLSAYDAPIREGDERNYACQNDGHWDDLLSLRKGERSSRRTSNTETLVGTIFTSDSDSICKPTSPPADYVDSIHKPHPLGGTSPENILRCLFQKYIPGQDNTTLLCKALEYATSEELEKEITRTFHSQCRMTQTIIAAQIPWASAIVGLSSREACEPDLHSGPSVQERLLKALEQSNQTLLEALEMYRELESPSVKEILPPSAADAEVPSPPSCIFPEPSEVEVHDTPQYLQPLPVLPHVTNPNQFVPSTPEGSSQTPARSKSLNKHAGSVPLGRQRLPIRRLAQAHVQPTNTNNISHPSNPPFDASHKEASSFLNPSYRAFSASSPSLQLRSAKVKLGPPITDSTMGSSHDAKISSLSAESSTLLDDCFSTFSPSPPVLNPESPDETVIDHNASDVPKHVPTGLCPPPPSRATPDLPDLTGKVIREGEYPAGRGGYADVWKCAMRLDMDECKVAVKVLQSHTYDRELDGKIEKRIRREMSIWQRLKHENVLPLLGTVQHFGRFISFVSPWVENGSLVQYLKECGGDMGMLRRLQLACGVAFGLSYLHSSGVVHGDLSGMNVLITEEGTACLCDFGLSTLMLEFHDATFYTSTIGANARWAAPEIYRICGEDMVPIATTKSDVYSFGCILLEVLSGLIPYHYLARDGQVLLELQNGTKPRRPPGACVTDALWGLTTACWAEPASQRPTAQQVVEFLQDHFDLERRLQRHSR